MDLLATIRTSRYHCRFAPQSAPPKSRDTGGRPWSAIIQKSQDNMINVPQTLVEATLASIYVFVLFIIVTSKLKVFKNPFYSMFRIADVTSISICCLFRINNEIHGLGPQFELLIRIAGILASASFVAHMLGNMLIAINRYTALCLKEKYDKVSGYMIIHKRGFSELAFGMISEITTNDRSSFRMVKSALVKKDPHFEEWFTPIRMDGGITL
ncbi:hypothetical protein COOONC_03196 [Cooperia oncophora]